MTPERYQEQYMFYEKLKTTRAKITEDKYLAISKIRQIEYETIEAAKEFALAKITGQTERLFELSKHVDKLAQILATYKL